ncbi:MAG: gas vesicle protein GvpO [Bacillota bacterium]
MLSLEEVISKTLSFFERIYNREAHITGVSPENDGWLINVEIVEEDDYMRKRGRREVVGIYDVMIDGNLKVISFKRTGLKERGTITPKDTGE